MSIIRLLARIEVYSGLVTTRTWSDTSIAVPSESLTEDPASMTTYSKICRNVSSTERVLSPFMRSESSGCSEEGQNAIAAIVQEDLENGRRP